MVFLIKYSCACVGVNKLSDLTTCTVQIQSSLPTVIMCAIVITKASLMCMSRCVHYVPICTRL